MHRAHPRTAQHMLDYLLRQVRHEPGVQACEGVDGLAVHLLASTGLIAELRELLEQHCEAQLQPLQPVLTEHGCMDALGLLQAADGLAAEALATWQVQSLMKHVCACLDVQGLSSETSILRGDCLTAEGPGLCWAKVAVLQSQAS